MNLIPFVCPKCGTTDYGPLLNDVLYADPDPAEPCVQCVSCEAKWRVALYEVEDTGSEAP